MSAFGVSDLRSESLAVFVAARFDSVQALLAHEDPALIPVQRAIADRLYAFGRDETVVSSLVQSCQRTLDSRTYRFHLRDGLKFHDGSDLTAADVVQNLQVSLRDPSTPLATFLHDAVDEVRLEVASRVRFEVRLPVPVDDLFAVLALAGNPWLSTKGLGHPNQDPVYSGLYSPAALPRGEARGGPLRLSINTRHPRAHEAVFPLIDIYQLPRDHDWLAALIPLAPVLVLGTGPVGLPADLESALGGRWSRLPFGAVVFGRGEPRALAITRAAVANDRSMGAYDVAGEIAMPPRQRRRTDESFVTRPHDGGAVVALARPVLCDGNLARLVASTVQAAGAEAAQSSARVTLDWHCGSQHQDPIGLARRVLGLADAGASGGDDGHPRRRGRRRADGLLDPLLARRDVAHLRSGIAQSIDDMQRAGYVAALASTRVICAGNDRLALAPFLAAGDAADLGAIGRAESGASRQRNRRQEDGVTGLVQMVAHDVRRPFSMVRMIMDAIAHATTLSEVKEASSKLTPGLVAALRHVDGMLADILEAGSDRAPEPVPLSARHLLEGALGDSLATRPRDGVALTFDLQHTRCFAVEPPRLRRVVANIVTNALEAMDPAGAIDFSTRDVKLNHRDAVYLVVANTESVLPSDRATKVFEPYYTFGKPSGTGLGLTIARKIVEAHGGRIFCRTEPQERRVSFHLILPSASEREIPWDDPPRKSEEARRRLVAPPPDGSAEQRLRDSARERLAGCRDLRVLVIDDDPSYGAFLRDLALRIAGNGALTMRLVTHADGAYLAAAEADYDLIICDVDLSATSQVDGFVVAQRLRESGYRGVLCIHSNTADAHAYVEAVRAGADAFLPKPMSEAHLARFLVDASDGCRRHAPSTALRPLIVVVDDDPFVGAAWQGAVQDADVLLFPHPAALIAAVQEDLELFQRDIVLVFDWYFNEGSHRTLAEARGALRQAVPQAAWVLSTDAELLPGQWTDGPRLEKRPHQWHELSLIARLGDQSVGAQP